MRTNQKVRESGSGNVISLEHRTCYGAYIEMGSDGLFKTSWCYTNPQPANNDTCVEIACILGAAYAGSKDFWLRLHGLSGLMYYGGDEELLSTKVWSIGGKCLLVKDWMTGHIYLSSFPYEVQSKELFYNKLLIVELFYPYKVKRNLFLNIQKQCHTALEEAYELLRKNYSFVKEEKMYWRSISKRPKDDFVQRNIDLEH